MSASASPAPAGPGHQRPAPGLFRRWWPWLDEVSPATLKTDVWAGLLGAALVLPQGIAFAALAGLPPAMGLTAAVLPTIAAALVGSSRHVLSGPTNATSLALGAMLAPLVALNPGDAVVLSLMVALMVGLLQAGVAVARLGSMANFLSSSVMLGFTTGAAALIAWYALAGLLGGEGRATPPVVWAAGLASWPALGVGLVTLGVCALGRWRWKRGPYMLVALVLSTAMAWALHRWQPQGFGLDPVAALGGLSGRLPVVVGDPPSAWPWPTWPWTGSFAQGLGHLRELLPIALAVAIIALGQTMAIATALAARSGDVIDANRECLGQGVGNIVAAFSSGMVSCGSLNRSLPNLEAGARTPLAGVASGLLLPVLVALAAPMLAWIPMAGVSALLLVVAWALFDRPAWVRLWRLDRREFGIAAATGLGVLALPMEIAVLGGVTLSMAAYLWRSARPALRSMGFDRHGPGRTFVVLDGQTSGMLPECPQLKLLRVEGSVWFGAVPYVADHLRQLRRSAGVQPHLLVMAKSMNFIDLPAADLWEEERRRRTEMGGDLYFHRPRPPVMNTWRETGFLQRLGTDHIFPDKRRAIAHIVERLDSSICERCTARVFAECSRLPGAPINPVI